MEWQGSRRQEAAVEPIDQENFLAEPTGYTEKVGPQVVSNGIQALLTLKSGCVIVVAMGKMGRNESTLLMVDAVEWHGTCSRSVREVDVIRRI